MAGKNQTRGYIIRLAVQDGKKVESTLQQVGEKGEQSFKRIGDSAERTDLRTKALARSIMTRLVPALSAAALGRAVRGAISDLAQLQDTANKLGLSAEKIQEIRYAAEQVGIGTNTADMAMQRFIRRVGEAQQGMGELKGVLEQYNVALKNSDGTARDAMDILGDLADVIGKTENSQEQLRIAFKAFDSEGVAFVNVLKEGREGLDSMREEARKLGIVTDENVKKAKEFDDTWTRITFSVTQNFKNMTLEVLKDFETLINGVIRDSKRLERFLNKNPDDITASYNDMLKIISQGDSHVPGSDLSGFSESLNRRMAQIKNVPGAFPTKQPVSKVESKKTEEKQKDSILGVVAALKFKNEQLGRTAEQQELYNQLKAAGVSLDSASGQEIQNLVHDYFALEKALEANEKSMEALNKRSEEFGNIIGGAVESAIVDFTSLSDVANSVLRDLQRMFVKEFVSNPISDFAGSAFKSLSGGLFGGGPTTPNPLKYGPPLKPFAGGGISDRPAIFGEAGPEAAVPLPDGRRIPVDLRGSSGGDTYYIDARGADEAGFARLERTIRELNGSIERRSISAVENQFRRNPRFLRA